LFSPIIETLKELGDSGTRDEIKSGVLERIDLSDEIKERTTKSGGSYARALIGWAMNLLVMEGLITPSGKGVYSLTEKSSKAKLDDESALALYKEIRKEISNRKKKKKTEKEPVPEEVETGEPLVEATDHRSELLEILQSISPKGFERICQRLLREAGFQQVVVTGRSGDGGIDGHGILQVNPLVSFNVLFQCKRYKGSISPSQIRDFRGAMSGRADKGIFITTGTFTTEASREGRREGVPPIELVDGDKLVDMFELLELGLKPQKAYVVDRAFFDDFE
jgi:restriction system protein